MINSRDDSARTSNITISIAKSMIWIGAFFAGAFLWLGPVPAENRPAKEPTPPTQILEGEALERAMSRLGDRAKTGEIALIYVAGHDPVPVENGEGTTGLPAR